MPEAVNSGVNNPLPPEPPVASINPVPPVGPESNLTQPVNPGVNEMASTPIEPAPSSPSNVASGIPPLGGSSVQPEGQPIEQPLPPQPNAVPPIAPTPAYTNPQTINTNPTPGFESSNNIGTNPPMSFEAEKQPIKNKQKKLIFIIIIIVVLAGVGFGTYYVLNYTNLLNNNNATAIDIKTKNIEIAVGDDIPNTLADLAVISGIDASKCTFDTSNVDNTKTGVYEYTVSCNNLSNTGKITVKDSSKLNVALEPVYKAKGETLTASEFSKNNNDIKLEFVDSSEIEKYLTSEPGIYTVKLKATVDNDSKELEGKLIMLEYPIKGFYTCTGSAQTLENSNIKDTVGDMFIIINGGNVVNGYGKVAYEIHTFDFSGAASDYAEMVTKYNNEGTLTINDVTGDVTIDDNNKTITIKKELKNEDVIKKYGEENIKDYASIRDYYNKLNTQNPGSYTCKYEKSN